MPLRLAQMAQLLTSDDMVDPAEDLFVWVPLAEHSKRPLQNALTAEYRSIFVMQYHRK